MLPGLHALLNSAFTMLYRYINPNDEVTRKDLINTSIYMSYRYPLYNPGDDPEALSLDSVLCGMYDISMEYSGILPIALFRHHVYYFSVLQLIQILFTQLLLSNLLCFTSLLRLPHTYSFVHLKHEQNGCDLLFEKQGPPRHLNLCLTCFSFAVPSLAAVGSNMDSMCYVGLQYNTNILDLM